MTQTTVGKSARLLAATALAFAALGAQAQTSAITYPSVARSTPAARAAEPATAQQRDGVHSPRQRIATEPTASVFVYETLGATPSIRLPMMRQSATADLQASLPNR
jgi:hypothetical protein